MPHRIQHLHEQLYYGITVLLGNFFATLGALLTEGDARWLCITFAVCLTTSAFLSLIFKRPDDKVGVSVGRAGLSTMCGIFGSRVMLVHYGWEFLNDDTILLGGASAAICLLAFILGFAALRWAEANSNHLAGALLRKVLGGKIPETKIAHPTYTEPTP